MRWSWPIALAGSVLTGALFCSAIALTAMAPTTTTLAWLAIGGLGGTISAILGALVTRRCRNNIIGPLLVAVGASLAFAAAREAGWEVLAQHPAAAAHLDWLVALLAESSVWLLVALALLLLFFPDGRLPGSRWRAVPPGLVAAAFVHHAFGAVDPAPYRAPLQDLAHPFGAPPVAVEALALVADVALLVLVIASAASLVVRFRRAGDLQRRQLKWLAVAGCGVPAYPVVCLAEVLITGEAGWIAVILGVATLVGIPVAITIALLRHDLYDVDRALATVVAYVLATAALLVLFVVALVAAGLLLGHDSTAAAVVATALGAVALSPLRRRLQHGVDHRLYPLRQAALTAIEDLQHEINAGTARPEQLAERLRVALRDPGLRIGYLTPGDLRLVDESGVPLDATRAVPVLTGGVPIGALLPASPAASPELLRQVAAAAATPVELVRLRLELSAALREVEASRARLVQAGDEERRRLERDLHDGAQQRLVSLGMALRLAQRHLDDGPADVDGLIDHAVAELGTAVAELRQIAHGLRPSSLDDGLHAALVALTQHVPIPVSLRVEPEPLPDDVTITVYYVASEAIANAVKHADATRIDVAIEHCEGRVEVRIADDGCGGATVASGSGLAGLSDRLTAVGGRLVLESGDHRGTVVEAVVPCAS
jgi:signal transduction histidine kinase